MLPKPEAAPLTRLKVATALARRISSESLLGAERELVIVHNGREYRLRLTQLGKLILTA
jgi:hemin uptake protein HemP